MVERMRVQ